METERSAQTSVAIDQAAQNNVAQDLHIRQHRCEKLKLRTLGQLDLIVSEFVGILFHMHLGMFLHLLAHKRNDSRIE